MTQSYRAGTRAPSVRGALIVALLQVGFTMRAVSPKPRCALTAPFHPYRAALGGLLSVALSFESPRLAVNQHHALWSSDFPPAKIAGDHQSE